MKQVVVVGGGFAGLAAARALGREPEVEVTLVDRRNHHLFQPLLYQVATAGLSPAEIAAPIRSLLSRFANVRVLRSEAQRVDLARAHAAHRRGRAPVRLPACSPAARATPTSATRSGSRSRRA